MSQRQTLLVGSIPGENTSEAVSLAFDELGPTLRAVPDGETGTRSQWVVGIINELRNNPALKLKRDGTWANYKDHPVYSVRRGARLDPQSLNLGYDTAFHDSRSVIDALAREQGVTDLTYQVGVASGLDTAMLAFGLIGAFRYRKQFNRAAADEMAKIADQAGSDVIFQLELGVELSASVRTPALLRRAVTSRMAAISVELAEMAPPGSRFGIHLCFGDLGNHAMIRGLRDCSAAVGLANAIVARWPAQHRLEYIHIPLAAGEDPPALDASYYQPLARLTLPPATRLAAGFVHEKLSDDQLRVVLGHIEAASGGSVDVAAACGLGRRSPSVARHIMHSSRLLCEVP